jgi:spermidine/putrescine transport system permease protein
VKTLRVLLATWTGLVLLFLYVPLGILVVFSFNTSRLNVRCKASPSTGMPRWAHDAVLLRATGNSLIVAAATTALAVALGTGGAWLLQPLSVSRHPGVHGAGADARHQPRGDHGRQLLILFVTMQLELGYATIIISHVTFCFPFVLVAVQARLAGLDPSLEEAALDLGATPAAAFRTVVLPLLAPAILSGALMAASLSLDELIVTYFTASAATRTLPLEVFGRIKRGLDPSLNAVSTLFIASAVALVVAVDLLARRRRLREQPELGMP